MHPQIRMPEPGQCPICGMDLIPASGDQDALPANQVRLSERARSLAKIVTVLPHRHVGSNVEIRLLGRVDYDETRLRNVTAWTAGRIDRLHLRATGERVRRGQVVGALYSPEVYAAQQDVIAAKRQLGRLGSGSEVAPLAEAALEAARERLVLLGVPEREVARMESATRPDRHVSIRSPFGGTVIERVATEGAYVQTGTVLYRIADLSKVWVQLEAYEDDLGSLSVGQKVRLEVQGLSSPVEGEITFIDPTLDPRRRVARVRVEVDNADGSLRPGVFTQATVSGGIADDQEHPLFIPATAPLFTGRRSVVYVELAGTTKPTYEARVVRLGSRMGDRYPVVAGLSEDEPVVVNGAFVLDADLQIRGGASMMTQTDDRSPGAFDDLIEVSDAVKAELAPIVSAYLDMADALANDDMPAAKSHAASMLGALPSVSPDSPEVAEAWQPVAERLEFHGAEVGGATTIDEVRNAFEPLGAQISAVLRQFGNPLDQPVRLAFCPMAAENQGAEWLQREDTVLNAYFGENMLTCGEIRATVEPGGYLGGTTPTPGPATEHRH